MYGFLCAHCGHQSSSHEIEQEINSKEGREKQGRYKHSLKRCAGSPSLGFTYKKGDYGDVIDEFYADGNLEEVPPELRNHGKFKRLNTEKDKELSKAVNEML